MAIVVENVLGERRDFEIYAEPSAYVDKGGEERSPDTTKLLVSPSLEKRRVLPLENREKKSIGIAVQPVGVGSGTYAFNVWVAYKNHDEVFESYTAGRPLKFYVVVP